MIKIIVDYLIISILLSTEIVDQVQEFGVIKNIVNWQVNVRRTRPLRKNIVKCVQNCDKKHALSFANLSTADRFVDANIRGA